jgi:hypothetical protein
MNSRLSLFASALGIGVVLTSALAVGAFMAHKAGAETIARVLFWPNTLLQELVPPHNVGTPAQPLYEGTPLNFLAFLASFPLGLLAYSVVAYVGLAKRARHET